MITSDAGRGFMEGWEELRLTVYADQGGRPTVGYGHLVRLWDHLNLGDTITQVQADGFFARDILDAERCVNSIGGFAQYEFDALVSFVYNVGTGNFMTSTLRGCLLRGDKNAAADQFRVWHFVKGVPSEGLAKRRAAERRLFLTGEYNSEH